MKHPNKIGKYKTDTKIYQASPYKETIVLDSDMLCLDSIDYWWDILSNTDLYFTNHVKNFLEKLLLQICCTEKLF